MRTRCPGRGWLRALAALSILCAAEAAAEVCTFPAGVSEWGADDDACAISPGAFAGCTCDPGDSFLIGGAGSSASEVHQVGHLDLLGDARICVQDEGHLVSDVVARQRPLRIRTGSVVGGVVGQCAWGPYSIQSIAASRVTFQGGYLRPGRSNPPLRRSPVGVTGEVMSAGRVVPCAGDCTSTPERVRFEYERDDPERPYLAEFIAAVDPQSDLLCFFDPDPLTDVVAPVDVNHCYRVVATEALEATLSIDIDVTQQVHSSDDPYPRSLRSVQCGALAGPVQPGDRWIAVADGVVHPTYHRSGRWIRLETQGAFEDLAYKILAEERGVCSVSSGWRCSEDHDCPLAETCALQTHDWIQVGDVRGVAGAHDGSDPDQDEYCVDYGHAPGDTFFVVRPVEITGGGEHSVSLQNDVTHLDGLFVHQMRALAVVAEIAEWFAVTLFDMSGPNALILGHPHQPAQVSGARVGLTMIAGGLGSTPGAKTGHGALTCTENTLIEDWSIRYRGDDCINTCTRGQNFVPQNFERIRCAFVSNDNGGAEQSGNFIGNNDDQSLIRVVDGVCDACTTGDSCAGLFTDVCEQANATTHAEGILGWGSYGAMGSGERSVLRDVMMVGARLVESPTGWPLRRAHSVIEGGDLLGFVARDNWISPTSRSGSQTVLGMEPAGADGVGRRAAYRGGILDRNRLPDSGRALDVFKSGTDPDDPESLYENLLVLDHDCLGTTCAHYDTRWACDVGKGRIANLTLAERPGHAASVFTLFALRGSPTNICAGNEITDLVLYGLVEPPGDGPAARLLNGIENENSVFPSGAEICFEANTLDVESYVGPLTGNLSLVSGAPLGLVSPANDRFDPAPGSLAEQLDCGIRGGAQAPGIHRYRWMHAISRIAPERAGAPVVDNDLDGVPDAVDNCPYVANRDQVDSGRAPGDPPDGVGDACQCGDVNGNGVLDLADIATYRAWLSLGSSPTHQFAPEKCDVGGGSACDLSDVARLSQELSAPGEAGITQSCAAAGP